MGLKPILGAPTKPRLMTSYDPPTGPLRVIHRDDDLLLVDKPSGLLSVPGKPAEHADCLEARVKAEFPRALLIHRLDLETSGIMVFALNPNAQKAVNRQFEKRIVKKTYIARAAGSPQAEDGLIDLPLIADWPNRPLQKVCHETGKPAPDPLAGAGARGRRHPAGTASRDWPEPSVAGPLERTRSSDSGRPVLCAGADPERRPAPAASCARAGATPS